MLEERTFSPLPGTFVQGQNAFSCLRENDVIVAVRPIRQLWQVRLDNIPNGETRSFETETDVLVQFIQEIGVSTRRNWNFELEFPSGDSVQWDIVSNYQAQVGNLAIVRAIYWQDVFLPKNTTVSVNGSTNNSSFLITGEPCYLASYRNIES